MKLNKILLTVFLASFFLVPIVYATDENATDIYDGYAGLAKTPDPVEIFIQGTGGGAVTRGFTKFNISGLTNDTIRAAKLVWDISQSSALDGVLIKNMTIDPQTANNAAIFADVNTGTTIGYFNLTAGVNREVELNATAIAVIQNALTRGDYNLSLGYMLINETQVRVKIRGQSNLTAIPRPVLVISYGDFIYVFDGPLFENGNTTTPVTVTAAIAEGNVEFVVSGTTPQYFNIEPLIFYWDLGGGATRRIYSVGSENLTVTIPDDAFAVHTFTVRDFTNKLARGDAYLEAWRIISTEDTLIERVVIDVHNQVPLNLVTGATYSLRVRFYDNSSFTWGFFVPGQTLTTTIVLRGVETSDQAYLVGNFIAVEITRPIATQITVDYQTSKNTTIWSNVTVIIRNGALVAFQSYAVEGYTLNVAGLDADTSYTVLVEGDHTLQEEWAYSSTFDATEVYPDVPNIEDIFPMAALDASNLIAWVFTIVGGVTFSLIDKRIGLIVMSALASFFSIFGFADWNFYLLSLSWFFSIVVYLGGADK